MCTHHTCTLADPCAHLLQVIKLISQVIADFADGEIDQSMHKVRAPPCPTRIANWKSAICSGDLCHTGSRRQKRGACGA
jgi:hypothetical protein